MRRLKRPRRQVRHHCVQLIPVGRHRGERQVAQNLPLRGWGWSSVSATVRRPGAVTALVWPRTSSYRRGAGGGARPWCSGRSAAWSRSPVVRYPAASRARIWRSRSLRSARRGARSACIGPVATPQEATEAGSELGVVERFEHVVVGAEEEESGDPREWAVRTPKTRIPAGRCRSGREARGAVRLRRRPAGALPELSDQCHRVVDGDDIVAGSLGDGAACLLVGISDQDGPRRCISAPWSGLFGHHAARFGVNETFTLG